MSKDVTDPLTSIVPRAITGTGEGTRARPGGGGGADRPLGGRGTDLLAGVPLFARLSKRQLRRLAQHADVASFREGEFIVRQDQAGGTFYVILEGEAKVLRGGRTISTLDPGDFFGEISLLDGGPRTADVVAATPLSTIRVFKKAFDRVIAEEPGVAAAILAVVAERLRRAEHPLSG